LATWFATLARSRANAEGRGLAEESLVEEPVLLGHSIELVQRVEVEAASHLVRELAGQRLPTGDREPIAYAGPRAGERGRVECFPLPRKQGGDRGAHAVLLGGAGPRGHDAW
jgi:hypothetical protein